MSLSLLQNATAMATNLTLPFEAINGTPPYVYSVVPGGAGGSINPSTGIYTSPDTTGADTIMVTDSLAATATADITIGSALQLFCDVIKQGMGLDDDQIWLWDQKVKIPNDYRLYIAVETLSCRPFGNTPKFRGNEVDQLKDVQSANFQATLSVDIFSRDTSARDRKEEVILALNSNYSQSQQELNSFRIFTISGRFVTLNEVDGAAIPYRFNISVNIQYFVYKTISIPFFDTFNEPQNNVDP